MDARGLKKKLERTTRFKQAASRIDALNKTNKLAVAKFIRERRELPNESTHNINKTVEENAKKLSIITKNYLPNINSSINENKSLKRVSTIQIQKNSSVRNEVKGAIPKTTKTETLPKLDFNKSNRNTSVRLNGGKSYESTIKNDTITINIQNTSNGHKNVKEELEYWQNNDNGIISAIPRHDKLPIFKKLFPRFDRQPDTHLLDYNLLRKDLYDNQRKQNSPKPLSEEEL